MVRKQQVDRSKRASSMAPWLSGRGAVEDVRHPQKIRDSLKLSPVVIKNVPSRSVWCAVVVNSGL